jgi:hypothetical protein
VLFERNDSGEREHALGLIAEARDAAEELGLSRLRARLADLQHPLLPDEPAPARTAILRRDGKYWTIGLDNQLTMPQNVTLLDLVSTVSR